MQIVNKDIHVLTPADYNPRKISDKDLAQLKKSLVKFECVEPAIVNINPKRNNIIVGGHQRIKAAKELGWLEFPCIEVNLTLAQEKELNIRLNKNTGEFDFQLLNEFFDTSDLVDWGFDSGLFEIDELDEVEGATDDDSAPEAPEKPVSIVGDIWQLGNHRLMCGDSTDAGSVHLLLDGNEVDMVFTDPPYGISIVAGGKVGGDKPFGKGRIGSSNIVKANSYAPVMGDDTIDVAIAAIDVIKTLNAKVEIIWGGNYYANHLGNSSCWIVWDKENTGNFADAELAWTNQDSAVRIFKHMWNGMIKASEHGEKRVHPTQKPVALAEWAFEKYGDDCVHVLDLFGGSGSTLIACEKKKRNCFMMELSPNYVDVIINRWQNFTEKKAVHIESGKTFAEISQDRIKE